jgi:hypothetical protein
MYSDTTPYGAAFRIGQHVHVQDRGAYSLVMNGQALRWVTAYQVNEAIRRVADCPAQALAGRDYHSLRRALLASPFGHLERLIDPQPRIRPRGVPGAYRGIPVIVCDEAPVARSPGWMGEHLLDPDLRPAIYLETAFARAIAGKKRWDILAITLEHERRECAIELALVRSEFPQAARRQLGGLCLAMSGIAHKLTIRQVDGLPSERADNDLMDRWARELGLPRAA